MRGQNGQVLDVVETFDNFNEKLESHTTDNYSEWQETNAVFSNVMNQNQMHNDTVRNMNMTKSITQDFDANFFISNHTDIPTYQSNF